VFNSPGGGVPWDDLRKIFMEKSGMAKVPNGVETLPKISIVWVGCTNVTERRQTDGQRHIANVRNCELKYFDRVLSHVRLRKMNVGWNQCSVRDKAGNGNSVKQYHGTRLFSNLRPTTHECVYLVTRTHFRFTIHYSFSLPLQAENSSFPQILSSIVLPFQPPVGLHGLQLFVPFSLACRF